MSDFEVFNAGETRLQSGATLPDARLAYKTYGRLNQARDNALIFPTAYMGDHTFNEWMIQPGKALSPDDYFVIVPNMLGNGLSSSPSNTASPLGGSAKTSRHNFIFLEGLKAALKASGDYKDGNYTVPPTDGLHAFASIYAGWGWSQAFFRERLDASAFGALTAEEFIVNVMEPVVLLRDANDLLAMLASWQASDISSNPVFSGDFEGALGAISARTLVMPSLTDLYFPPEDNEIEVEHMPNAVLRIIPSIWGHMAGSGLSPQDAQFIDAALADLLST